MVPDDHDVPFVPISDTRVSSTEAVKLQLAPMCLLRSARWLPRTRASPARRLTDVRVASWSPTRCVRQRKNRPIGVDGVGKFVVRINHGMHDVGAQRLGIHSECLSGCELSWTGPIERNVLTRIRCPLKLEAECIDNTHRRFAPCHKLSRPGLRAGWVHELRIFSR